MELGKAYIGIHADGAAFPKEAEEGVDAALRSIQTTADEAFAALQAHSDEAFTKLAAKAEEAFKAAGSEIDAIFGASADTVAADATRMGARITELAAQIEAEMGGTGTRLGKDWNTFASIFGEDAARIQVEAETAAQGTAAAFESGMAKATEAARVAGTEMSAAVAQPAVAAEAAGAKTATAMNEAVSAIGRVDAAEKLAAEGMTAIGTEAEAASAKTVAAMDRAAAATERAAAGKTASVGDGLLGGIGSQAKALAPIAGGLGIVEAIKQAGNFQSNLTKLSTTAGELPANLGMVRAGITDLSNQYGVSANNIAKAMYLVDSSGFQGAHSLEVMKSAVQGSVQEHADLTKVVDGLTTTLHDYSLGSDKAAKVTSMLVAGTSTGKISFEGLTGALHNFEPAAQAGHQSIQEVVADMAALTASGMGPEQASENLRGALRNFESPSLVMRKALADIGLNADDLTAHLGDRGLTGTLQLVDKTIRDRMGPSGEIARNILNTNRSQLADLGIMATNLTGPLHDMAGGLLTGAVTYKDFKKAADETGGTLGAQAQDFYRAYKNTDGFSQTLKSGQPLLASYLGEIKNATGTQDALSVFLQLTGEHAGAVNDAIKKTGEASATASGDIAGWAEVQDNFNVKLGRAEQAVLNFGISIGNKALPVLSDFAGWIAEKAIPALSDFGHALSDGFHSDAVQLLFHIIGDVGGVALTVLKGIGGVLGPLVDGFSALPAPVQLVVGALVALKAAAIFGLFEKMAASSSSLVSGLGKAGVAVIGLKDAYSQARTGVVTDSDRMIAALEKVTGAGTTTGDRLAQALRLAGEKAGQSISTELGAAMQKVAVDGEEAATRLAAALERAAKAGQAASAELVGSLERAMTAEAEVATRAQAIGTAFSETMPRTAAAVETATGAMVAAWNRVTTAASEARLAGQRASMGPGQAIPTLGAGAGAGLAAGAGQIGREAGGALSRGLSAGMGSLTSLAGGPGGIALMGAISAYSRWQTNLQDVKSAQDAAAQSGNTLANTYVQLGTTVGDAASSARAQAIEQAGIADAAKAAGVSTDDLTQALSGNNVAATESVDKMRNYEKATAGTKAALDPLGTAIDWFTGKTTQGADATKKLIDASDGASSTFGIFNKHVGAGATALESYESDVTRVFGDHALPGLSTIQKGMGELDHSAGDTQKSLQGITDILDGLTGKGVSAAKAQADLTKATLDTSHAFDTSKGAIDPHTKALNLSTAAGAQLYQQLEGLSGGFKNSVNEAYAAAGGINNAAAASKAAGDAAGKLYEKFVETATGAGMSRDEAEKLAKSLGLVPQNVVTAFTTPGLTQAQAAVATLQGQVAVITTGQHDVTVTGLTQEAEDRITKLGFHADHLPDGSVRITADTIQATAALDQWIHDNASHTISVTITGHADHIAHSAMDIITNGGSGFAGGSTARARGGIDLMPFADGGLIDSSLAQVIPPQTYRLVGDRMANDESFIPIDGSSRSKALWAETGQRLGVAGGGTTNHFTLAPSYQLPASAPPELVGAIVATNIERDLGLALAGNGVTGG